MQRAILFGALCLASCSDATEESRAQLPALIEALEPFSVAPEVADTEVVRLAYRAPTQACPHVVRIVVDNEPALMHEPDSTSFLSLAGPGGSTGTEAAELTTFYRGFRAEQGVERESTMSDASVGPASPTAGCLPKTWDPVQDAMTLGWPVLTGRLTAIGERWTGHRVAGKCNRAACVDPKTGGGGPENHHRTCVTEDWQNELLGVFEHQGERLALVQGTWTDGHGAVDAANTTGIWAKRLTLINVEHGRPMWSRHRLHHSFPQPTADKSWAPIDRTWEMQSADACPGSLAAHGWARPADVIAGVEDQLALQADPSSLRRRPASPRPPVRQTPTPSAPDSAQPYIVPIPNPDAQRPPE